MKKNSMHEYKSFHKFVKTKFYELEFYVDEFYAWILIMHSGYLYSKQKIGSIKRKIDVEKKRTETEFYFCVERDFLYS